MMLRQTHLCFSILVNMLSANKNFGHKYSIQMAKLQKYSTSYQYFYSCKTLYLLYVTY